MRLTAVCSNHYVTERRRQCCKYLSTLINNHRQLERANAKVGMQNRDDCHSRSQRRCRVVSSATCRTFWALLIILLVCDPGPLPPFLPLRNFGIVVFSKNDVGPHRCLYDHDPVFRSRWRPASAHVIITYLKPPTRVGQTATPRRRGTGLPSARRVLVNTSRRQRKGRTM